MTVLVDLASEPGHIFGDLGLQRRREHLAGTITHDLVQRQRVAGHGLDKILNYLEHGRTFPTGICASA